MNKVLTYAIIGFVIGLLVISSIRLGYTYIIHKIYRETRGSEYSKYAEGTPTETKIPTYTPTPIPTPIQPLTKVAKKITYGVLRLKLKIEVARYYNVKLLISKLYITNLNGVLIYVEDLNLNISSESTNEVIIILPVGTYTKITLYIGGAVLEEPEYKILKLVTKELTKTLKLRILEKKVAELSIYIKVNTHYLDKGLFEAYVKT